MSKKRVMWWNLPPEEIDELREQGQLKSFTCLEDNVPCQHLLSDIV